MNYASARRIVLVIVSILFCIGVEQARATIIIVEPDNFSVGQDLTNAVPGVTFSVANALGDATSTSFNQVIVVDGTAPFDRKSRIRSAACCGRSRSGLVCT